MKKFLKKNNKKVMAFFGVFLMIAFAAQSRYGSGAGGPGAAVIGHIGDDKITESDLQSARQQWQLLKQSLATENPQEPGQYVSFLAYKFRPAEAIEQDPKLYLLLLKEAERLGTGVSDQDVQEFLSDPSIFVQLPTGSITRFDQLATADPDYAIELRQATAGFLSITQASGRALDLCKLSQPLKDFALAEGHQNITVRLASFDAGKFTAKLPAPTTQQLQQQFDQFANVESTGSGSGTNLFGCGYKIPDQVRIQTISVSHEQIKQAITQSKSSYDWDVEARGYYLKHKADFPSTQPVAPPASAMMTLPTTQASPYKAFEVVKAQIMDQVMAPDVDELNARVQKEITSTLAQDWTAYHAAHPDTQPRTAPALPDGSLAAISSLGVPYDSYDYLKALAAKIQKDCGILPVVSALNKPMTEHEIVLVPGIGLSQTASSSAAGPVPFGSAVMDPTLALFQPSAPLNNDDNQTTYQFRVTDRIAAHRPASMADVAPIVKADWIRAQSYQAAQARATALRDAAAKTGLLPAAAATGDIVVTTPPFSAGMASKEGADTIPSVPLTGDDVSMFKDKCQSILEAAAKHEPAVAVVEAPNEFRVLVIELDDVQPDWPKGQRYIAEATVTRELMSEFGRQLASDWYKLASVEGRLGYVDAQAPKKIGT